MIINDYEYYYIESVNESTKTDLDFNKRKSELPNKSNKTVTSSNSGAFQPMLDQALASLNSGNTKGFEEIYKEEYYENLQIRRLR